jgi:hypothetical protein
VVSRRGVYGEIGRFWEVRGAQLFVKGEKKQTVFFSLTVPDIIVYPYNEERLTLRGLKSVKRLRQNLIPRTHLQLRFFFLSSDRIREIKFK